MSAERVVAQVADLDSISRNQLFFILEGAARDTSDCVDYRCTYCPGYRLVIHDANPPMFVTIGEGCFSWTFKRDGKQLRKPGGCGYVPSSFIDPLTKWIVRIYGPLL